MDIFVANGTHFSAPSKIARYHASEREAQITATDMVNQLRADLDAKSLPPVDTSSWQLGLVGAQCRHLASLGIEIADIEHDDIAETAGFDVWIEKAELLGISVLALNDRELSTVLAALRDHQRRYCGSDPCDIACNLGRHEPLNPDEIDDLCMRINGAGQFPLDANIVVTLDGGLVQGVVADRPITLRIVDYDVEGADPDGLVMVPQDNGDPVPASVSCWAVEGACIDPEWIARLDAASRSDDRATAQMAAE